MNKEYKIKLDLNKKLYNKKMAFNQFDKNVNDFYIEVTKNNEVVKDLDKSIITLVAIKPNNTVDAQFIEVKEGQIYADLKPSMCDLVGNYQAKAMIVLEGEIVTTDTINYSVNEDKIISRLNDDIVSDERFTLFTDALARLSAIEISEEQRQINEAERILSEENRKIEEAKRVEAELIRQHEEADRAKYDATRESNENIRKQNESIRLANETNRIDEEAKRVEEENKRKLAEEERNANYNFMTEDEERRRSEANAHKEAEVLRVQAETNRVNEEAKRRTTEQARVLAENTRVSNENTRKANETTRQTNEIQRVEAETQRQNRYNSFIADAEANANNFENYTNTAKVKEEERKSNELDRKSQEDKRVSNEVERIFNENTRKANEVTRIESEKQRADAENLRKEKIIEIQSDYDSLKKVIIDENVSANLQNQIDSVNSQLEHKANEIDLDVERKRIDQLTKLGEGSTTGDAELVDLRVGIDGTIYSNAGSAVRSQIDFLMDKKADSIDIKQITGKDVRIIEPSTLVLNNGIMVSSSWSGIGESNKHTVINITPGYNYTLIGGNGSSSYCFLTSYDIPTSSTSPINYAYGYTSAVSLPVSGTVNITAPSNARFLYITMKANNTDRTPSLIQEDGLPSRLGNIENNIDKLNYMSKDVYGKLDEIDLSTLKKYPNFIANDSWRSNTSFACVMLPVDGNEKILMRGTGVNNTYTNYAFLTSDEINVGSKAHLCDGENGTRKLNYDEEISIETPSDCKFMYILLINNNNDKTPSLIKYNHFGIDNKIDILNNDMNKLKNDVYGVYVDRESMEQISTMMMVLGNDFFNRKAIPIKIPQSYDTAKYNAWPFIHELNGRLICVYTKALAHSGSDTRSVYCKHSFDGIVWSKEIEILTDVKAYGAVTAIGKDNDGNLLFWLRNGGIGNSIKHELYKTTDGYEFSKIAEVSSPNDYTIEGLTSIMNIPGVGLMSFFCTYLTGSTNVWGTITSNDNGLTWVQHPIESNLSDYDCPTEINGVYVGDGKIIGIGRRESTTSGENVLHQLESSDYGNTWTRANTNIDDIWSSTSTLMYEETSGTISEFYIRRSTGTLKLRECNIDDIWNNPKNWPDSIDIHAFNSSGESGYDGGQANGVYFNGTRIVVEYSGVSGMTSIYVTLIP